MQKKKVVIAVLCTVNVLVLLINIVLFKETRVYFKTMGNRTTCNTVMVVNKDKRDLVITVKDKIYNSNEYYNFDIYIRNENTWNLIQNQQTYFVNYTKAFNGKYYLDQIEIVNDYIE